MPGLTSPSTRQLLARRQLTRVADFGGRRVQRTELTELGSRLLARSQLLELVPRGDLGLSRVQLGASEPLGVRLAGEVVGLDALRDVWRSGQAAAGDGSE